MILFSLCFSTGVGWSMNISTNIFHMVVDRLMRAPVDGFYDKNPLGRILNRVSADQGAIDFSLYIKTTATLGILFWWVIPVVFIHSCLPWWFTMFSVPFYVLIFTMLR